MTHEELEVCERFKQARLSLNMKQGDFAHEIATTQGHVSDIENKRKGVSDRLIAIICLKWGFNEEWLRYGTGDMFTIPEDKTAAVVENILTNQDDVIYKGLVAFAETYSQLSPSSQKALQNFANDWFENLKNLEN